MLGTVQTFCICPFTDSHEPFVLVLVGSHFTDEVTKAQSKHSIKARYYYYYYYESFKDPRVLSSASPLLTGLQMSASRYPPKSRAWALRKRRDTPSPGARATFLSLSLSRDTCGTRGGCEPVHVGPWPPRRLRSIEGGDTDHVWGQRLHVVKGRLQSIGVHVHHHDLLQGFLPHSLHWGFGVGTAAQSPRISGGGGYLGMQEEGNPVRCCGPGLLPLTSARLECTPMR